METEVPATIRHDAGLRREVDGSGAAVPGWVERELTVLRVLLGRPSEVP